MAEAQVYAGTNRALIVLGVVLALLVVWRTIAVGMGQYYAGELQNQSDPRAALLWNPANPWSLYLSGKATWNYDPQAALIDIRTSLAGNPANGYAAMTFALAEQTSGNTPDGAVDFASRVMPGYADVRLQAAYYWFSRGRYARGVENWSAAVLARPSLKPDIFPAMMEILESPGGMDFVSGLTTEPPAWWPEFFSYVSANAGRLQTMPQLYALRKRARKPVSETERNVYADWLIDHGRWPEAYVTWINGLNLSGGGQRHIGQPYNGSFEQPFRKGTFNWKTTNHRGLEVDAAPTFGAAGSKALRVRFYGEPLQFDYLRQFELLMPGHYRLQGRAHVDTLRATQGIQWSIECSPDGGNPLGSSERFVGSRPWHDFAFEFDVPEKKCAGQILRLHASGGSVDDLTIQGTIWFDNLRIMRL